MRRAVARGRVFPQSFSTDRRYGRLSLKAVALFPLIWVNADDQGRLCGDPEEVKYTCCPNVDHLTKADIPGLLHELQENKLIIRYSTQKSPAIQIIDWWDPHRSPQWAWPSDYPSPKGWQDHLRYKKDAKTVETLNWPVSGEDSGEGDNSTQVRTGDASPGNSGEYPQNPSSFPQTPIPLSGKGKGKGGGRGRGKRNSPEASGEDPHPHPRQLSDSEKKIYDILKEYYRMRWGIVRASDPHKVIPRQVDAKAGAQLRDLAVELADAGGCREDTMLQAFNESSLAGKQSISYLRAILFDWLGISRERYS